MILADENIDHNLIVAIRQAGIDVYSIYEMSRGLADIDIIELSRNPPRIILTEDKDFGEWVFAHNIKGISVLLLRYHFSETEAMKLILVSILKDKLDDLWDKFTTVSTRKIRIRPL